MTYQTIVNNEVVFTGETVSECIEFGEDNFTDGYQVK